MKAEILEFLWKFCNFWSFDIFWKFWNFEIFWNFWSFEICCPMKKRFKGQFNSLSLEDYWRVNRSQGSKKCKNILKYVVT
jgi:hypothetical protein